MEETYDLNLEDVKLADLMESRDELAKWASRIGRKLADVEGKQLSPKLKPAFEDRIRGWSENAEDHWYVTVVDPAITVDERGTRKYDCQRDKSWLLTRAQDSYRYITEAAALFDDGFPDDEALEEFGETYGAGRLQGITADYEQGDAPIRLKEDYSVSLLMPPSNVLPYAPDPRTAKE